VRLKYSWKAFKLFGWYNKSRIQATTTTKAKNQNEKSISAMLDQCLCRFPNAKRTPDALEILNILEHPEIEILFETITF
jgi:hypothetical protein